MLSPLLLALAAVVVCLCSVGVGGQSYVPQAAPMSSCSSGSLVSFGNNSVAALDNHGEGSGLWYNDVIYVTPFLNSQWGVVITQLSLGLTDNSELIYYGGATHLRLGLFSVQADASLLLVGQTDEITLYPSSDEVLYANLLSPVLLEGSSYVMSVWIDNTLFTGYDNGNYYVPTSTYAAYTGYPYPGTASLTVTNEYWTGFGTVALQATGCIGGSSPFTAANTAVYSFCAYSQAANPPLSLVDYTYAAVTVTTTIGGFLAVSTTNTGSNSIGPYGIVTAVAATFSDVQSSLLYYMMASATAGPKTLALLPTGVATTANQQLYTGSAAGAVRLDGSGIAFLSSDGIQYVASYNASTAQYSIQSSTAGAFTGSFTGFTATLLTQPINVNAVSNCVAKSTYTPEAVTVCPAGSTAVQFGDSVSVFAGSTTPTIYGNAVYFRQFTANTPNTMLTQLSWNILANPDQIIHLRLGLFQLTAGTFDALPTFTLLQQTKEIVLDNVPAMVVVASLIQSVTLVQGMNYSIGAITDSPVNSNEGYWEYGPIALTYPYSVVTTGNTFAAVIPTQFTDGMLPLGANGCAQQSNTVQFSFCAVFVYNGWSESYSGVLTALAATATNAFGTYYTVISGSGVAAISYETTTYNFTVNSFNLDSNNLLYTSTAASAVDSFGLQIVVTNLIYTTYSVQLMAYIDPTSGQVRYQENQQYGTYNAFEFLPNLNSTFSYQPYTAGGQKCTVPLAPINSVSPYTAPSLLCPALTNSIQAGYGNAAVTSYALHTAGTSILPNTIYTQAFTATTAGTISQLSVGLLSSTASTTPNTVQLGLYGNNNALLAQTQTLTLIQVVNQQVLLTLPIPVNVVAGGQYFIAIIANLSLNLATTATATSPTMSFTFDPVNGLPATFASTGQGVSPSVAAQGCSQATHSFCAYFQYYIIGVQTNVFLYQGLLQASPSSGTNAFGSFSPVLAAAGRQTSVQRTAANPIAYTSRATFTAVLAPGSVYTSSANGFALDSVGLTLMLTGGQLTTLLFNSSLGVLQDSSTLAGATSAGYTLSYSNFTISALTATSGIPSCGQSMLPSVMAAAPALPVCSAGQSLVYYGDAAESDLSWSQEGWTYAPADNIFLRQITAPSAPSVISQVSFGINLNYNVVARMMTGIYNSTFGFMSGSNQLLSYNPTDSVLVGSLAQPQQLIAGATYWLAMWTESAIFAGFQLDDYTPTGYYVYGNPWPTAFQNTAENSVRSVGGYGCTTGAQTVFPSSSGSPSSPTSPTSPWSSSSGGSCPVVQPASCSGSSGLSNGAIAGIVIGSVVGALLVCLLLCFAISLTRNKQSKAVDKTAGSGYSRAEESRTNGGKEEPSELELSSAAQ
jgi:hypothetical protein